MIVGAGVSKIGINLDSKDGSENEYGLMGDVYAGYSIQDVN
jgi:hypothetical protein